MSSHFSGRALQYGPLTNPDPAAVFKLAIRVAYHSIRVCQPLLNHRLKSIGTSYRNVGQDRPVIDHAEHLMLPVTNEDRGFRKLQDIV